MSDFESVHPGCHVARRCGAAHVFGCEPCLGVRTPPRARPAPPGRSPPRPRRRRLHRSRELAAAAGAEPAGAIDRYRTGMSADLDAIRRLAAGVDTTAVCDAA